MSQTREKRKRKKLKCVYSGAASRGFWDRLNAARERGPKPMLLYLLGCTLQDLESRVLQLIEELEAPAIAKQEVN